MVRTPTFLIEVVVLPIRDVERALRFYVDRAGFILDVDYAPTDAFELLSYAAWISLLHPDRQRNHQRDAWFSSQSASSSRTGSRTQESAAAWSRGE